VQRDGAPEDALHHLSADETAELEHLREAAPARVAAHADQQPSTFRDRVADALAAEVGSWRFLVIQSIVLTIWIAANVIGWIGEWDPYPFILLNLLLSLQTAYMAPIIMMSQNRQANIDRRRAITDSEINLQAALEIKFLHEKVDSLIATVDQLRAEIHRYDLSRPGLAGSRSKSQRSE
jgi:uncharacterized membrane protein